MTGNRIVAGNTGNTIDASFAQEIINDTLSWPITRAHIRQMSGDQIVEWFDTAFEVDYKVRRQQLARLAEVSETDEGSHVEDLIERLESRVDSLKAPKRRSSDGTLGDLVLMLPDERQLDYVTEFLRHSRRSRRRPAHKVIARHKGHGHDMRTQLEGSYRQFGDREALLSLVANSHDISELLGDSLNHGIRDFSERYHQALAIEQILVRDQEKAFSLARSFPMAFLWAAARQRLSEAVPFAVEFLEAEIERAGSARDVTAAITHTREMPLIVWALERIGAKDYLRELADRYHVTLPDEAG